MLTEKQALDIRSRHDAVRAWLKAQKRNSYKTEELRAAEFYGADYPGLEFTQLS